MVSRVNVTVAAAELSWRPGVAYNVRFEMPSIHFSLVSVKSQFTQSDTPPNSSDFIRTERESKSCSIVIASSKPLLRTGIGVCAGGPCRNSCAPMRYAFRNVEDSAWYPNCSSASACKFRPAALVGSANTRWLRSSVTHR